MRLSGRWRRVCSPHARVVVVHGFSAGQDEDGVRCLAEDLATAGFDVLTYDGRGHGRSAGMCGVGSTEHLDVAAAVEQAGSDGVPVVLVGVSMGAIAVVRYLAAPQEADSVGCAVGSAFGGAVGGAVAGAVLVSAPACWRARVTASSLVAAFLTRTRPGRWAARHHLGVRIAPRWKTGTEPESLLREVRVPLVIVHGAEDRMLGVEHAYRLRLAASSPVSLAVVPGMGHGLDGPGRREVSRAVSALATPLVRSS